MKMIDQFFLLCVEAIKWFGDLTGLGYNLANILLFVILQPALIVLFFYYGEGNLDNIRGVELFF